MGVVDGSAHLAEQGEPLGDGEVPLGAEVVDGRALDVVHDEVGQPLLGGPAVEQPCDVRMVEGGQDLTLVAEAPHDVVRVPPELDDLERDLFLVIVVADRQEDEPIPPDPIGRRIRYGPMRSTNGADGAGSSARAVAVADTVPVTVGAGASSDPLRSRAGAESRA